MTGTIETLEQEHAELLQRIAGRRAELETVAKRLAALPSQMVDAPDTAERDALFAEHLELQETRHRLLLELDELGRRAELASLAILEATEQQARQELEQAQAESTRLRLKADELTRECQRAMNGTALPDSLKGDQNAIDLHRAKLAGAKAKAWALSTAGRRAVERAAARWKIAQNELEQGPTDAPAGTPAA